MCRLIKLSCAIESKLVVDLLLNKMTTIVIMRHLLPPPPPIPPIIHKSIICANGTIIFYPLQQQQQQQKWCSAVSHTALSIGLWAMKDKRDEDESRVAHWIRYFISLREETDAAGSSVTPRRERECASSMLKDPCLFSLSLSQLLYSIGRAHSTARRLRAAFPFLIEFRQISPLHHATTVTTTTTTHNMGVCLLLLLLWSWRDAYSLKREKGLLNKKKEFCSALLRSALLCSERIFSNVAYSLYTCTIPHCSMNDPKRDEGGGGGWRGEGGECFMI